MQLLESVKRHCCNTFGLTMTPCKNLLLSPWKKCLLTPRDAWFLQNLKLNFTAISILSVLVKQEHVRSMTFFRCLTFSIHSIVHIKTFSFNDFPSNGFIFLQCEQVCWKVVFCRLFRRKTFVHLKNYHNFSDLHWMTSSLDQFVY